MSFSDAASISIVHSPARPVTVCRASSATPTVPGDSRDEWYQAQRVLRRPERGHDQFFEHQEYRRRRFMPIERAKEGRVGLLRDIQRDEGFVVPERRVRAVLGDAAGQPEADGTPKCDTGGDYHRARLANRMASARAFARRPLRVSVSGSASAIVTA